MTDRELVELAAKAAGIEVEGWDGSRFSCRNKFDAELFYWNPLTDDGDRYKLARDCKLAVDFDKRMVFSRVGLFGWKEGDELAEARAIVRAAAEIGRTMP